jgi:hypothetical protein
MWVRRWSLIVCGVHPVGGKALLGAVDWNHSSDYRFLLSEAIHTNTRSGEHRWTPCSAARWESSTGFSHAERIESDRHSIDPTVFRFVPSPRSAARGEGQGEGLPIKAPLRFRARLLSPALSSIPNGGEGARLYCRRPRTAAFFATFGAGNVDGFANAAAHRSGAPSGQSRS